MQLKLPLNHLHIYHGLTEDLDTNSCEAKKWLRILLALYAGTEASDVKLSYGLNGKPYWNDFPEIQFNATHSCNAFALAFVRNSRVGIDLEDLKRPIDTKTLSSFLLSEKEREKFYSTDEKFHPEQMINAWTRKEAFVKAYGRGMSFPVQQLEVSFMQHETASVNETHWSAREKFEWYLHSFDLAPAYRGAVAVQGRINSIALRNMEMYNQMSINREFVNQL